MIFVYAIVAASVIGTSYLLGYRVADGNAAQRELNAAKAVAEVYHAKELEYIEAASRLEESQAALAARTAATAKAVSAVGNRPLYMRDCFDDDGLRAANGALNNATTPP